MHVICDVGAMSDVRGRDHTVPDAAGSGWMYESESGMCRIGTGSAADGQFNHQAELETGVLEEECSHLMKQFFRELRQRKKEEKEEKKRAESMEF